MITNLFERLRSDSEGGHSPNFISEDIKSISGGTYPRLALSNHQKIQTYDYNIKQQQNYILITPKSLKSLGTSAAPRQSRTTHEILLSRYYSTHHQSFRALCTRIDTFVCACDSLVSIFQTSGPCRLRLDRPRCRDIATLQCQKLLFIASSSVLFLELNCVFLVWKWGLKCIMASHWVVKL